MNKTGIIFFLLCFYAFVVSAQSSQKVNGEILRLASPKKASVAMTDILVKGDVEEIKKLTQAVGGTFKYAAGSIAAVRIPANTIHDFAVSSRVKRMESYRRHMVPLNDTMRMRNNVNE